MHPRLRFRHAIGVLAACAWIPPLPAATFEVTTPAEFQAALTTAAGNNADDVIEVAAGTYQLSSTLTYNQPEGGDSLTIMGAGAETTILDGGETVQVMSILTGGPIELRNLTFRNGLSSSPGGGLRASTIWGTEVTVLDCRFLENRANANGGGLWVQIDAAASAQVLIEGSLFESNVAEEEQGTGEGGGARITAPTDAVISIVDTRFAENLAAGAGGGLMVAEAGRVNLTRTDFVRNQAGGESASHPGGGADIGAARLDFLDLELYDNRASAGGGMMLRRFNRLDLVNSVFMGNYARDSGGGVATADVVAADVLLLHNTLHGNTAGIFYGGGAYLNVPGSTSHVRVINNVIWGNVADDTLDLYVDNQLSDGDVGGPVTLQANNATQMRVVCTDPGLGCTVTSSGNLDLDPMLLDSEGPDYDPHLRPGSPMIDAGVVSAEVTMPEWDFDGPGIDARVLGNGPDIGADEFFSEAPPASADLAVTVTDQPDPVPTGGRLTYTATVTNAGPDAAEGVTVTNALPVGVSFVSAAASQGSCARNEATVTCGLGALASSGSASVTLVVDVTADGGVTLRYTASVDAATADPDVGNDSATATTQVIALRADLSVSTTVTPSAPQVGDTVTFTVTVANAGPDRETAATVDLTLPTAAGVQSVTPAQGTCKPTSGGRYCLLGALAAGAQTTVTVILQPTTGGTLSLGAVVRGDLEDPNAANDSVQRQLTVTDKVAIVVEGRSGKGSFGWLQLLGLAGLAAARRRRPARAVRTAVAAAAVLLAAALSLPAPAEARDAGWYVGASVGAASADYGASDLSGDLAGRGWTISDATVDDSDTFWKAYAGYAVNDLFAVEAGYAELGEIEARYGALVSPGQIPTLLGDTVEVLPSLGSGWSVSAVLTWSFAEDAFAVFGRAGLFVWEADVDVEVISGGTGAASADESGTDAMFGLGLEWRAAPSFSLRVEWERYKLDDWVDVPSAGVVWRFR